MENFVDQKGLYQLQECLKSPHLKVKQQVFEIVPHIFKLPEALSLIKGKTDFITSLYDYVRHSDYRMRLISLNMFNNIIMKLSRGATAFNLVTKAAVHSA